MILRILLLACAILSPSFGLMDIAEFSSKFAEQCFQNDITENFRINGQDMPLSNTLESFIALAEKFEAANPLFDLKKELSYFIQEYLFENILFSNGNADEWKAGRAKLQVIQALWDPEERDQFTAEDPFTEDEKCSLYYMISHSLLDKDSQLLRSYSPGNYSFNPSRDINPDLFYPQELGAVAIRGTKVAVSLSKVLIGLYVGLFEDRMRDLNSIGNKDIKTHPQFTTDRLDVLYAVTLAEVLMQSEWSSSTRQGFATNGNWLSTKLSPEKSIKHFCPMVYKQEKRNGVLPAYSYSSVRGAADGLILGLSIPHVYKKKGNTKLSQILRMYYSPDGISLDTPIEETDIKRVTFCNREDLLSKVEHKLHDQLVSYGYVTALSWKEVETITKAAEEAYGDEKRYIYEVSDAIRDYCAASYSTEKPEELPRETFLDVIVVMDSSNSEDSFQEQQMIVGNLARQLDLRYTASRMTILLDHKMISDRGTSSMIQLKPVVLDTYSSSCAACTVGQIPFEPSSVERDEIIVAIDQFLQERKENETSHSGVNGKVVVYFNYDSAEGRNGANGNNRIQGRLFKALRDLHLHHQDIIFYAVGLDPELLKKYAKNDPALVFLGTGAPHEEVAEKIFEKISFAPALLQYADCVEARNERGATYENFVSPHKIQHYEMPAEYFYKSRSITINFESQNGYIKVCHNRATMRPENEARFCKNTTGTASAEFKVSNPCKNFNKESCSPFYFSIMGMNSSPDMRPDTKPKNYCDDINDHWCGNLDQIKYKVSHTGIRCSGCLGLAAPPAVVLFTVLLAFFISKHF